MGICSSTTDQSTQRRCTGSIVSGTERTGFVAAVVRLLYKTSQPLAAQVVCQFGMMWIGAGGGGLGARALYAQGFGALR